MKKTKPKSRKQILNKSSINKPASKEEILKAIHRCATKLKRTPTFRDLKELGVDRGVIERRWNGLLNALTAAGLEARGTGFRHPDATWLLDWASVARLLRRIPTVEEYEKIGRFCHTPLHSRFRWTKVPDAFARFAHAKAWSGSGKTCWIWWRRVRAWEAGCRSARPGPLPRQGGTGLSMAGLCRWKSCCTNR